MIVGLRTIKLLLLEVINGVYALNINSFKCVTQKLNPDWKYCQGLGISDSIEPQEVRLLIGVDNPDAHIQIEVKHCSPDPKLGWALMGLDGLQDNELNLSNYNLSIVDSPKMDDFWSTEAFGVSHSYSKPT